VPLSRRACLAALALALVAVDAAAQTRPRPTSMERTDRNGVRWEYGERVDPMDDGREIALIATHNRATIGLLCMEGLGTKMSMLVPGWAFGLGAEQTVQVRVDRAEPFEVSFVGDSADGRRGTVRPDRAGRDLARGFASATERVILRNSTGATLILPIAPPRPEAMRFQARCAEIAPVMPE